MGLRLSQIDETDELLTRTTQKIARFAHDLLGPPDPLALLIGMVLD